MIIRRLFLYSAFLLVWPVISMAASFPTQKLSTLPCLIGQPGFSERLIANNPWVSGKVSSLSESFLWHGMVNAKLPFGPYSVDEMKLSGFPKFSKWEEYVEYTTTELGSLGTIGALGEVAIYFNRWMMLYFSGGLQEKWLNTFAFVLDSDNNNQPFNLHFSIGKFPIHFGSGFSEYPLVGPLQVDLGATANLPAISLNGGYRWDLAHQTKLRIFGFVGELSAWTERGEKTGVKARKLYPLDATKEEKKVVASGTDSYWGMNLHHEWTPDFATVHVGVSGVSGLPIRSIYNARRPTEENHYRFNQDGFNIYTHVTSGDLKMKLEALGGGYLKKFKNWVMRVEEESDKKRKLPYAGHIELAYRLPFKKESTGVIGYTRGMSELLMAQQRVFLGIKTNLLKNLQGIVGYQLEYGLKRESKQKHKYAALNETDRHQEARHRLTFQLNFTV